MAGWSEKMVRKNREAEKEDKIFAFWKLNWNFTIVQSGFWKIFL